MAGSLASPDVDAAMLLSQNGSIIRAEELRNLMLGFLPSLDLLAEVTSIRRWLADNLPLTE
jgi:hypothetical protein